MGKIYDLAQGFVQKWEGGLSDDAADHGGLTNYGVATHFLTDVLSRGSKYGLTPPVTPDMIRALTAAKAAEIFKGEFWDRLRCDEMPPKTAIVVYDAAVNTGRGQSVKFLQRTLGFTGKDVDGLIGPKTIAATQDFTGPDLMLAYGCIEQRERFYADLTNSKPALSKFLKGWLNRCRDLRKFISDIQL